ncbi:hypothetical protein L1887_56238 [Cichorium endivia]|nr:hypothetical protein L1887_56238 [Cichorium endivia]
MRAVEEAGMDACERQDGDRWWWRWRRGEGDAKALNGTHARGGTVSEHNVTGSSPLAAVQLRSCATMAARYVASMIQHHALTACRPELPCPRVQYRSGAESRMQ